MKNITKMAQYFYGTMLGFSVDDRNAVTYVEGAEKELRRNLGLQKEEYLNDKYLKALQDPVGYLTRRNVEWKALNSEILKTYAVESVRLARLGETDKEAKRSAEIIATRKKEELVRIFRLNWPIEVTDFAKKKAHVTTKALDDKGKEDVKDEK